MKFKTGQYLVYPGHGVGRVERLETKEILGAKHKFCRIRLPQSGMVIMFPVNNADAIGIRPIATKAQARKILVALHDEPKVKFGDTWSVRYREYMDQIKTGDLLAIAKVFATIKAFQAEKEISFGERKMLDNALNLLVTEIGLALELDAEEINDLYSAAV